MQMSNNDCFWNSWKISTWKSIYCFLLNRVTLPQILPQRSICVAHQNKLYQKLHLQEYQILYLWTLLLPLHSFVILLASWCCTVKPNFDSTAKKLSNFFIFGWASIESSPPFLLEFTQFHSIFLVHFFLYLLTFIIRITIIRIFVQLWTVILFTSVCFWKNLHLRQPDAWLESFLSHQYVWSCHFFIPNWKGCWNNRRI